VRVIDNKALLLKVRNPAHIAAAIPHSKVLDKHRVLVRWGVDESRVLKNLDIKKVPSPITGKYKWLTAPAPFEHQKTTAAFLTMHQRCFCFNEQGTGKTASAIWASDFLLTQKIIKRVLVICPLSIMDSAWRADLFKFAMHRTVNIAYAAGKKRASIIEGDAEYIIINYDGVQIVRDEIEAGGFDLIIVDEATHYKNTQTKRWKTLNSILKPDTWLWMMTGTPAAQSPVDAFGLAKLVNPKAVPRYVGAFKDQVMYKITTFKWLPKKDATTTVHRVLQPAIRFTKEECLDLPELTYVKREVALTKQQEKYYDALRRQMLTVAAGEQISAANAAVVMNKLRQISCGAVYADSHETVTFDIKNRYKVLREAIDESSQKILVFVPYRNTMDVLLQALEKDGITTECINGQVKPKNRTDIFNRFQTTENPRVLLIQPQAAAHGVTLTAANTIVWWGPVMSLETYAQANARFHRSGQHHPCTVIQLQGSNVEKRIYDMLDNKIAIHTKIIDLYKEILE
jgi:SNF2 family DNA or RNA helicase